MSSLLYNKFNAQSAMLNIGSELLRVELQQSGWNVCGRQVKNIVCVFSFVSKNRKQNTFAPDNKLNYPIRQHLVCKCENSPVCKKQNGLASIFCAQHEGSALAKCSFIDFDWRITESDKF